MFPLNRGMIKINEDKIKPFKIILNLFPSHISFPSSPSPFIYSSIPIPPLNSHLSLSFHHSPSHTHLTSHYIHPYQSLQPPPPFNPYQSLPSLSFHPIPNNPPFIYSVSFHIEGFKFVLGDPGNPIIRKWFRV